MTQDPAARQPATHQRRRSTTFLWWINISGVLSPPQESGLRSYSGIWAPGQGTPTDRPAT